MGITSIAWIGTGVMGRHMCGHLIDAGYKARVYNRTKSKTDDLVAKGAVWCDTPARAAESADVVFTIVGFPADVEAVILGEEGVLSAAKPGATLVDMTTSQPALAVRIAEAAKAKGIASLDAPVSGGDVGARDAKLAIMVGGEQAAYDAVLPLFEKMGQLIRLMGGPGAGQHTKMSNQTLIAGNMIGAVESLLYAYKAGLDLTAVMEVVGSGAARSFCYTNLGPRIVAGDYDPGFYIKHFVKDMGIALDEAKRMNLGLPGLALVHQFYCAAQGLGFENLGTQALYKVLAHLSAVDA